MIDWTKVKTQENKFTEKKKQKIDQLKTTINNDFGNGVCSLSLGWDIDCRRSATHNDVGNMEGLLKLSNSDSDVVSIKGADNNFHSVTIAELRDVIIPEMYAYGFGLYQKKWEIEEMINNASTEEQIDAITF